MNITTFSSAGQIDASRAPDFATLSDAELERRIAKHHEPRRNYAARMGDGLHDLLKIALTTALVVTAHAYHAANDEGPNAPATSQRIAA